MVLTDVVDQRGVLVQQGGISLLFIGIYCSINYLILFVFNFSEYFK